LQQCKYGVHAGSIPASAAEGVNPETLKDKVDDSSERRANDRVAEMVDAHGDKFTQPRNRNKEVAILI